jgi:hypothetical protein
MVLKENELAKICLFLLYVGMSTKAANTVNFKTWEKIRSAGKPYSHVTDIKFVLVLSMAAIARQQCLRCCRSERLFLRGGERKSRSQQRNLESKQASGPEVLDESDESDESDDMSGADSQDMDEMGAGNIVSQEKSEEKILSSPAKDKAFDRKLDAYARKYGLSTGQPANPLRMLLEKADRSMDARTRFKIKKENFALQAKEMDAIKKQLREDDARRPCR